MSTDEEEDPRPLEEILQEEGRGRVSPNHQYNQLTVNNNNNGWLPGMDVAYPHGNNLDDYLARQHQQQQQQQQQVSAKKKKIVVTRYSKDRFKVEEIRCLMDIMENILPIGQSQWESVETEYNGYFPTRMRQLDNLRRQFNRQVKKKAPTGNPNIPDYVLRAKRIQEDIVKKAAACKVGDEDTDVEEIMVEEAVGNPLPDGSKKEKTKSIRPTAPRKKHKDDEEPSSTEAILKAFVVADKKDRRKERRLEKQAQQNWQMMLGLMTTAVSALSGRNIDLNAHILPFASLPTGGDVSDSDSDDSRKKKKKKHRKRKRKYDSSSSSDEGSDNDDDEGNRKPAAN